MEHSYLRILYSSGTGNTFRVSQWIADYAREKGWKVETYAIEDKQSTLGILLYI